MNHDHGGHHSGAPKYTFPNFIPLILIFSLITLFTVIRQLYGGWNLTEGMSDFMGAFFIVFGAFKVINWHGFAEAYAVYDFIAKQSKAYAYSYPLIELGLGLAYLMRWQLFATNLITLVVMIVSSLGVANELRKKKTIVCACLGVVFKIPMTYVTLIEDLLMAAMALAMLVMR